ncbi:hypothetical protein UFOVP129_9 [uncultured Caudovirales phage]|uniref:Uncharacterized protein n=1 Tax=uncultured Caudovirales phage TaxID=2100421 RepID=A0A6J5L840_9CAUD|nr:hypothetical protein UFOVP129_9 [uncultured Caudovirales phage]
MHPLILFLRRNFGTFTLKECFDLDFVFIENFYKDGTSLWKDGKGNYCICREIFDIWNF